MKNIKRVCHDVEGNEYEVDVSELKFRPSIYGILIEDNKVLLAKQWDGYDFPGGGVEIHETLEEALKREFLEETGVKVELIEPVLCATAFFTPKHSKKNIGKNWNCPMIYFLVKKVGGKLSTDNFDEEEKEYADMPEWIDIKNLENIKFFSSGPKKELIKEIIKIINNK